MALATFWRGDTQPRLTPLPGLTIVIGTEVDQIAELTKLASDEVESRLGAGHRIYIAAVDGVPAASGWVATLAASIGELDLEFALPPSDRYLWDFVTLPEWRGRGIYSRLLQGIVAAEGAGAERFWIIHAPENVASGSGIVKAGFEPISDLSFLPESGIGTVALAGAERAKVGAALLGVSFFEAIQSGRIISPCWRCVIEQHAVGANGAACWPDHGETHTCACVPGTAAESHGGSACALSR
jgi:GNAT superfamily N-acetyltransferase